MPSLSWKRKLWVAGYYLILTTLPLYHCENENISDSFCVTIHKKKDEGMGIGIQNFPKDIRSLFETLKLKCDNKCFSDQPDEVPLIKVYKISSEFGLLNGWLRVQVTYKQQLLAFHIAGEIDEVFQLENTGINEYRFGELNQAMGEFVSDFPTSPSCPRSDATPFQIIPCGGISRSEVTVPKGIIYVDSKLSWDQTLRKSSKGIVYEDLHQKKVFNFYFRFAQYHCNVRRFYFRMYALVSYDSGDGNILDLRPARTPFIIPNKLTGAWDPLHKGASFDCSKELTEGDWVGNIETRPLQIYQKSTCVGSDTTKGLYKFAGEWVHSTRTYKDVNGVTFPVRKRSARCSKKNDISDGFGEIRYDIQTHYCLIYDKSNINKFVKNLGKLEDYEIYIEKLLADNSFKCMCLNHPTHPTEPTQKTETTQGNEPIDKTKTDTPKDGGIGPVTTPGSPKEGSRNLSSIRGIRADIRTGKLVWKARIGHGVAMIIATLFITPLSIFTARYYKETWMGTRILHFRVWNLIHIQSVPSTWVFIIAGLVSISLSRMTLGTSLTAAAQVHRTLGWVLILLYFGMSFIGGVRCFENTPRKVCICCHWMFGNVFYFGCVAMLFISLYIPGSPLADQDASFEEPTMKGNFALYAIICWLIFDFLMNAIMTILLCKSDSNEENIQGRIYLPVPIPIIREDHLVDTPYRNHRKIVFFIYIAVALCMTYGLCQMMEEMNISEPLRGFGPMSCTHQDLDTVRENLKESCHWSKEKLEAAKTQIAEAQARDQVIIQVAF